MYHTYANRHWVWTSVCWGPRSFIYRHHSCLVNMYAYRCLKKETLSKLRAALLLALLGSGYPRPSSAVASTSALVRMLPFVSSPAAMPAFQQTCCAKAAAGSDDDQWGAVMQTATLEVSPRSALSSQMRLSGSCQSSRCVP